MKQHAGGHHKSMAVHHDEAHGGGSSYEHLSQVANRFGQLGAFGDDDDMFSDVGSKTEFQELRNGSDIQIKVQAKNPKHGRKWSQNGRKRCQTTPTWSQYDPKVIPKRSQFV